LPSCQYTSRRRRPLLPGVERPFCWSVVGQRSERCDMLIMGASELLRSLVKSALLSTRRLGLIAVLRAVRAIGPKSRASETDPPVHLLPYVQHGSAPGIQRSAQRAKNLNKNLNGDEMSQRPATDQARSLHAFRVPGRRRRPPAGISLGNMAVYCSMGKMGDEYA
jgi:hypothetical protein